MLLSVSIFKKIISYSFISIIVLTSCTSSNKAETDVHIDSKDAKQYLLDTGLEFASKIDAEDHRSTLKLLSDIIEKYEDYDSQAFDDYFDNLSKEFGFDDADEIYYAPLRILNPIVDYLQDQTRASVTKAGKDIIKHIIAFPKLYGKFTADDDSESFTFDKSVKDHLEINLYDKKGGEVAIIISSSSNTTRLHCTVTETDNEYNDGLLTDSNVYCDEFIVDVPNTISLNISHNGKNIVDAKVSTSLAVEAEIDYEYDEYYEYKSYLYSSGGYWYYDHNEDFLNNLSIDFSKINLSTSVDIDGYCMTAGVNVSKSIIRLDNSLKINNDFMYSLNASVSGSFSSVDNVIEDLYNSEEPEDDVPDILEDLKTGAIIEANVLNKVVVNLSCDHLDDLYNASYDLSETLDDGSISSIERCVKKVNKTINSGLYLNGSKEKTAYVEIDYFKDNDDYRESYYIEPILIFSDDLSSYRFENYFTERSFQELIDAYDEIVDNFQDLLDQYFDY